MCEFPKRRGADDKQCQECDAHPAVVGRRDVPRVGARNRSDKPVVREVEPVGAEPRFEPQQVAISDRLIILGGTPVSASCTRTGARVPIAVISDFETHFRNWIGEKDLHPTKEARRDPREDDREVGSAGGRQANSIA